MKESKTERYLASIDLGSTKTALCIALAQGSDVKIIYYKELPSEGILNGRVLIPRQAEAVVERLIADAEKELMMKIRGVVVSMPRADVVAVTAQAGIERKEPEEFISAEDIQTVREAALESFPLPDEGRLAIYEAVAAGFTIDDGITLSAKDVEGALSTSLKGSFHLFVGKRQSLLAVDKIFSGTSLTVQRKYFLPEVTAGAVLRKEELNNGVALVDIGGGVTSVSVFYGGILQYYAAIPFGGKNVNRDIATECWIHESLAENIKKRFGACSAENLGSDKDKVLQIRLVEPYWEVSVKYISEIIGARYRELIDAVLYHIGQSGIVPRCGIVLTGGGSEQRGLDALVREMSGLNVRLGNCRRVFTSSVGSFSGRLSATSVVGMILAASEDEVGDCCVSEIEEEVSDVVGEVLPDVTEEEVLHLEPVEVNVKTPLSGSKGGRSGGIGGSAGRGPKPKGKREKTGTLNLLWEQIENTLTILYKSFGDE